MTSLTTLSETKRAPEISAARTQQRHRRLLVFHLAGQAYGLPLAEVQEVVPMATLSRPLTLPAGLAGFLNLAGTAIPVLRLDRLFGLPELSLELYTPLIILRHPDTHLALLVERVSRIIVVPEQAVLPLPDNHSFNDCVVGLVTVAEGVVVVLSPERILLENEQQCLAELQDLEQLRLRELEGSQP